MARSVNNPLLDGLSGKVGSLLFKKTRYGTVVTMCPSEQPKNRKRSARQKKAQATFAAAVKYAKGICISRITQGIRDTVLPNGQIAYNAAVGEYMSKHRGGQRIAELDPSQYLSMIVQEQKEELPVLFDF